MVGCTLISIPVVFILIWSLNVSLHLCAIVNSPNDIRLGNNVPCPMKCICIERYVNCSYRSLTGIPALPSDTTSLDVSGNKFMNLTRTFFIIISTIHLQIHVLKIDHCSIRYVDKDAFADLTSLKNLSLADNPHIKNSTAMLASVKQLNLVSLSISNTNLSNIGNFECSKFMNYLNISNNKISDIGNRLNTCNNLTTLSLTGNSLDKFTFKQIPGTIQNLYLCKIGICKNISDFCNNSTAILPNLKILDISYNAIDNFKILSDEGHCLPRLESLDLDGSIYLRTLPDQLISGMKSLKTLSFNLQDNLRMSSGFLNSTSLTSLSIVASDHMNIQRDASGEVVNLFENCGQLEELKIANMYFHTLNISQINRLFSPLTSLKTLSITHGRLNSLKFIKNMTKLEVINFSDNLIKDITPTPFKNIKFLRKISIRRNRISTINLDSFPKYIPNSITEMDFSDNPFSCIDTLCQFRDFFVHNKGRFLRLQSYVCESGEGSPMLLVNWDPDWDDCYPKKAKDDLRIEVGCGIGSFIVLCTIVGIVLYKKRWYFKLYCRLRQSNYNNKGYTLLPDGEEFVYDAFVAYHCNDRNYLIRHLMPHLEANLKLKLCIHERDFLPGNYIVDSIISHMNQSRKIILVLSNDFARSEWCQFEVSQAFNRFNSSSSTADVILIRLEDINEEFKNNILRCLFDALVCIDWSNADLGRKTFWNRLGDVFK